MQMMKGIRKVATQCVNVKASENVLVVTDINKLSIAEALALEAYAQVTISIMAPRARHAEEPPKPVASAMKAADIMPTSWSLTHTKARHEANAAGARIVSLPKVEEKTFYGGGIEADFVNIRPLVERVAELFTNSETVRITTTKGTSLTMSIKGKKHP
jgi:leucyl aminopeptidase (aminopeptidase T)